MFRSRFRGRHHGFKKRGRFGRGFRKVGFGRRHGKRIYGYHSSRGGIRR